MMRTYSLLVLAALVLLVAGCDLQKPPQPSHAATHGHEHEGHSHGGHSHEGHAHPASTPHGGHLVEIADGAYHLEWTHDDETGEVNIYVLDGKAEELVPIASESIRILSVVKDEQNAEQTTEFTLAAVNPSGDPPQSAQFSLQDPALLMSINLAGQGAEVSVPITIEGQKYTAKFEPHDHSSHGHDH